jgi:hypothetical protein
VNDNLSNSSHCKGSKSMGGKGNGGKGKGSLYKDSDDFPAPAVGYYKLKTYESC